LARDDAKGQSELLAFAWDLQTNARSENIFIIPHVRGSGSRRRNLTGTQEIYENNASFAGRRLREAIFSVLPVWFKEEAAELCHKTLEDGGGKPLVQRVADLRTAFAAIGITAEQLEQKRGRKIDNFLPEDVAALRVVYGSLKRGEVTVADEFPRDEIEQRPTGSKLDALEAATAASPPSSAGVPQGNPAISADVAAPAGEVRDRDEYWWTQDKLTIEGTPREFQARMHQRIREARNWAEVERLRDDNGEAIDRLDKATKQDVLGALADREKELRANG
jgi:hypothetical protein